MNRFIVISGCSGGGKSTLILELARRGYAVVEEPGRRIVAEELGGSGLALPWVDLAAFATRAVDMALRDRDRARHIPGPVFFDWGLIDAAAALEHATGRPALKTYSAERYNRRVFLTPPWPEIYVSDLDRQHGLKDAIEEYDRLLIAFASLGYDIEALPRITFAERADIVVDALKQVL
ncbi:AAA family ATPase [Sphingomonas sp. H39-1-10]|uniref:AAA family ATPase n=1 Tax=Sphingomonas pollutisoli TaxID=3030829 RepID=UPI0023B8C953|nr:AAA family ATPase [Sphingomonas pollutisoli]MDF0490403.1 AAA family ATPase [Sphingomonas pollutisoli]